MAATVRATDRVQPAWYLFWFVFVCSSLYLLLDSVGDVLEPDLQAGSTLWNRVVWYVGHALIAAPILLIAPFQFMPGLRRSRPNVHRWLGRTFLIGSMLAGLSGIYLGGAFVWVRLINKIQGDLLGFIPLEDTQEATKEWLTLVLPILATELWLTWGPVAKKLFTGVRSRGV